MAAGQVLIVAADQRWLRVLEVTIRLAGAGTISRHSVSEALRIHGDERRSLTAMVVDLVAQTSPMELDDIRDAIELDTLPAVVILPERLAAERERFVTVGATVLVRPYRPSELYRALWPDGPTDHDGVAGTDEPLTVEPGPDEASADAP